VALLDALAGKRAQRREVLCEADRGEDAREFFGQVHVEDLHHALGGGLELGRAADGTDLDRDLDRTREVPVLVHLECRQRSVAVAKRGVGVRAGLDSCASH
jgi:hypothetical protein